MRWIKGLAALLLAAALAGYSSAPARAELVISIDKSTQRMTVSVDGVRRHVWPVSTGRAGRQTPEGSFKPFRLEEDHYSKEWDDAPMPHSIFFTRVGHAIHGSDHVQNLGSPASAGCVRLARPNAAALFALVKEQGLNKTRVIIDGVEPESAPAVARRRTAPVARAPVEQPASQWVDPYGRPYGTYGQPYGQREPLDIYAQRMRERYQRQVPTPRPAAPSYATQPQYYYGPDGRIYERRYPTYPYQ